MGRPPSCGDQGVLTKGHWLPEEDNKLLSFMEKNGHVHWKALPKLAGLNRCSKSCRLRWTNYLRPNIKRGSFSEEEEQQIIKLHSCLGNKWSAIASRLPGRTDNEIKNYWNTHLRKKLLRLGIDPVTHEPRRDLALLATIPALMTSFSPSTINPFYLHSSAQELAKIHLLQTLIQILSPPDSTHQNVSSMPNTTTTNCNLFGPNNDHYNSNSIPLMFHHDRNSNIEIAIPTTIGPHESLPYEPSTVSFDPNYNQSPMVSSASSSENYNYVANANRVEDLQSWFIGPPSSSSGFEFGDINW